MSNDVLILGMWSSLVEILGCHFCSRRIVPRFALLILSDRPQGTHAQYIHRVVSLIRVAIPIHGVPCLLLLLSRLEVLSSQ